VNKNLVALLAYNMLCVSCAVEPNQSDGSGFDAQPVDSDRLEAQNACFSQWKALLDDWKAHGGGFVGTLGEIRRARILNNKSRFAEGVKKVWRNQAGIKRDRIEMGAWPVSRDRSREVWLSTFDAFSGSVSSDCESVTWLSPVLWDEIRTPGTAEVASSRIDGMPQSVLGDAAQATNWLMYWIFVGGY